MNILSLPEIFALADQARVADTRPFSIRDLYPDIAPGDEYYKFIYLLTHALQPSLIVELGVAGGKSLMHFAAGYPSARVIGIDPQDTYPLPSFPNIEMWQGFSVDMADRVAALGIPIDLLFIDTDHTLRGTIGEYLAYSPLMRTGGIMLFDDIHLSTQMDEAWTWLPKPKYELPLHSHCGFGMIVKDP